MYPKPTAVRGTGIPFPVTALVVNPFQFANLLKIGVGNVIVGLTMIIGSNTARASFKVSKLLFCYAQRLLLVMKQNLLKSAGRAFFVCWESSVVNKFSPAQPAL